MALDQEESEFLIKYAEQLKGLTDAALIEEREKYRWAVPNRAPSFYREGDYERQARATPSETEFAKNEGKLVEEELASRGLAR